MNVDRFYTEVAFDTKEEIEMTLDLDYSDNARAGLLEKHRSTSKLLLGIDKIKRKVSIGSKKKVISLDAYEHLQWELVAANQTIVAKESEITVLTFRVSAMESASSIWTSKIDTLEQTIKAKETELQALRSKKEADDTKQLENRQLRASSIAANGIDGANKPKSDSRNSLKNEENYSKGLVDGGNSKSLRRASSHSPGTRRKQKPPKTSRMTLQNGELVQIPNLEREVSLRKLKRKEESFKRLSNKDKITPPASPGALKNKSPKTSRKTLHNDELVHQLDIPAPPPSPGDLKHKKKSPRSSQKTMDNDELVHQLDIPAPPASPGDLKHKKKSPKSSQKTMDNDELVHQLDIPAPPASPGDLKHKKKTPKSSRRTLHKDELVDQLDIPAPLASPGDLKHKKKTPKSSRRTLHNDELARQLDIPAPPEGPGDLKHKKKTPKTSRKTLHNDELVHHLNIFDTEQQEKWRKQKMKDESTKNLTLRDKSILPLSPRPLKEKESPRVCRKSLAVDPEGYTGLLVPLDERELIARNLQKEKSSTRLDAKDKSASLRFQSLVDLGDDAPEGRSPLRKKRSPSVSSRKTLTVVEYNGMAQLVISLDKEDGSQKIKSQGKVCESSLKPNVPEIDQKPMVVEEELVGDLKDNHEYKKTSISQKSRIRSLHPGFLKGSSSRKLKSRSSSPGLHEESSSSRKLRSISLFKIGNHREVIKQ
jgi:hypothetical protein